MFTIRTNRYLFFVALGMGATYFIANEYQTRLIKQLEGSLERTRSFEEVRLLLLKAETSQRGYLLTNDSEYLNPYLASTPLVDQAIDRLDEVAVEENQEQVDLLRSLSERKLAELEQTVQLKQQGRDEEALRVVESGLGNNLTTQIRDIVRAEVAAEETALQQRRQGLILASRVGIPAMVAIWLIVATVIHFWRHRYAEQ